MEAKKLVYIAGPITGIPNDNREAFYEAQKILELLGFAVINVFEIQKGQDMSKWTWINYILFDLPYLAQCDLVFFLKGWEKSYGAIIEMLVAFKLGKDIAFEENPASDEMNLRLQFENQEATDEDDFDIGDWFERNMKGEP